MKKTILFISFLLFACNAAIASDLETPQITVYGTAITKVTPDTMKWNMSVFDYDADIQNVAEKHSKTVSNLLAFLRRENINAKEIQTNDIQFGEHTVTKDGNKVKEGYYARTDVTFIITDFQKYSALWLGLTKSPQYTISGIHYDHSQRIIHQNETRQKALLAAKEKATALAKTLGMELGPPLLIEEQKHSYNRGNLLTIEEYSDVSSTGFSPGKIDIKENMKVIFKLKSNHLETTR